MSLRKFFLKSTASALILCGFGLPGEALSVFSSAYAEETRVPAEGSEQWMVSVYQEGKRLFDLGDYAGAQMQWDRLSGSYDKNPSLKVIVDFMRKRIKEDPDTIKKGRAYEQEKIETAQKQAAVAVKQQSRASKPAKRKPAKSDEAWQLESDKDVELFLSKVKPDVTKQVRASQKPGTSFETRRDQQTMLGHFAKGKQEYFNGNMSEAIASWQKAVDYLPANSAARRELEKLKTNTLKRNEQRKAAASAPAEPEPKVSYDFEAVERSEPAAEPKGPATPPDDMKDFLSLANARFRSEAQEGRVRAGARESSAGSRQEALNKSFQKSKLLYFQGQYEEAIDELNALAKYFSASSEEAVLIKSLRENYLAALEAQNAAKSAPAANTKLQTPAELRSFVEQANRKFDAMLEEAEASRSAGERTSAQRGEFVQSAFGRARKAFDSGDVDGALDELERVAPYVENETEILAMIEEVRSKSRVTEKAVKETEAAGAGDEKINRAAAKGISDFLADANEKLDEQSKKIAERKRKADSVVRNRGRKLVDLFQNAKSRYAAGDLEGALALLDEMAPSVEGGDDLARSIAAVRADYLEAKSAASEMKELEAQASRQPAPAELSSLLAETQANIRSHASQTKSRLEAARRTAEERNRAFETAYAAGRGAYNAGDLSTAITEWEKLVPLVDNGAELSKYLDNVRSDYNTAVAAEKSSETFEGEGPIRLPDDFYELLNQTAAQARERAQRAAAEKKSAESQTSKSRESINRAYEAGREAYNAGDLPRAVAQWRALVPVVQDGAVLGAALDTLDRDYKAAMQAIQSAEASSQRPEQRLEAPKDLEKLLSDAKKQIDSRAREARSAVESLEKHGSQRRSAFERALADGRAAYSAGDLNKAVTAWRAIVPMVQDGPELDKQLTEIQQNFQSAQQQVEAARAAEKSASLPLPADILQSLTAAKKDIEAKARTASSQKDALDKASSQKQAAYDRALADGAEAYNAGKLDKAIEAWRALVPLVEDGATLEKKLNETRQNFLAAQTKIDAARAAEKQAARPIPADILESLAAVQKDTEAKARNASAQKEALDKAAAQKQEVYDRAMADGSAAFKAGDLDKAMDAWRKLVPVIADGEEFDRQLTSTGQKIRQAEATLAASEKSQKKVELHVPADVQKWLAKAQSDAETRAEESLARKAQLEKTIAERKSIYDRALEAGSAALKAGRFDEALTSWQELATVVEDGDKLDKQIVATRAQLREAQAAKAAADNLGAQNLTYSMPSDMMGHLAAISKKLESDIAQSRELVAAAEAKALERRKRVETAITEGLSLYKSGLTAEALVRWEKILPDLEDSDRLQKVLFDLQQANREADMGQKGALAAEVESKKPLAAPADLTKSIEGGIAVAQAKTEEAKTRQTSANDETVRRQTIVTESVQNGKLALARGDVDGAIAEWTKLVPLVETGAALSAQLQQLKASHLQLVDAQKAAASADERNLGKMKSLPELDAFVTEASLHYKNDADAAIVQKEKAEASFAQKKAQVEFIVNKAREIFESGDLPGATLEALKLQEFVQDPVALQASVKSIQNNYDESVKAQAQATAAVKKATETKFAAPPDLPLLLKDADAKVKELTQLANNQKMEAEASLKEKEAYVQATFERGKKLYWEGKIDEALNEWDKLTPLLENGGKVKEVTGRYEETLHLQRQAREMVERKNEKFQTPEELQRLLNDAEKVLSSQSNYASTQQRMAQDELAGRQEFVNRTFQKGKALYEQGLIQDAIEEWEQLAPVLENGSKVKEFIDGVKSNYKGSLAAKKGAEEAQARTLVQPQAPADLTRLLNEANLGLQAETKRSHDERTKAEAALREKQNMIDGIFQKGKALYQAGRLEEAIDTWKTLIPFVDDNTSVRQLIQQAEDSRRELLAERFETQNNVAMVGAPATMQFALEETNAALKDQISQQHALKLESDLKALVGKKPSKNGLPLDPRAAAAGKTSEEIPFKLDEIEQMMLEYKVVTPEELQKRHDELKAGASQAKS